jgi:ribosomal-protein-serine acetyltransferase
VDSEIELKLIATDDANELYRLVDGSRDSLRRWLPWLDFDRSEKDQLRYIEFSREKFFETGVLTAGIWHKNQLAGIIGFNQIHWQNKSGSIGYWLGADFRRMGIMVRSCSRMISHGFQDLKLQRIEVRCAVENLDSRRIPERLNLKLEGCMRQAEYLYDHFVNLNLYSVLADEWEARTATMVPRI